jgi:hypothetical protein
MERSVNLDQQAPSHRDLSQSEDWLAKQEKDQDPKGPLEANLPKDSLS